jgi:DNA-binding transcriptional LysR family regulator
MTASIDDFSLFFAVAKAGTITAAARQLELPKSTVSRRLIQLEQGLGIKLFHKTTRKITLTGLGESFLERCERVVREAEEARGFLDSVTARATGVLRVTMPTDIGIHWLADFLVGFARRHPEVTLSLDFTGRRLDLVGERVDVAIRGGAVADPGLVARKLGSIERLLYASPDYLREAGTPLRPADLAGHRFVLLETHSQPRAEIELINGKRSERIAAPGAIVSNSLGMVRAMVAAGGGIGLLPQRMAAEFLAKRQLVHLLPGWAPKPFDFFYIISSRRLLPAKTRVFVEELVEHFRPREEPAARKARAVEH